MEAVGVPPATLVKAKVALFVAVPPMSTSTVLLNGAMVPGFTLCQKLVPTENPQELLLSTQSVPPVVGKVYVCALVAAEERVENAADCPPAKTRLPPLVTSNLVVPLAEASMISPLLDWLTMNAPLLPIPPLTDNGAMVLLLLPTNTPSWYVEVRIKLFAAVAEIVG